MLTHSTSLLAFLFLAACATDDPDLDAELDDGKSDGAHRHAEHLREADGYVRRPVD